ncbi:hypothetical protein BG004_005551 [Podila humilis]|nr:hypothetical protein BG004_005551 [Podila humilis]
MHTRHLADDQLVPQSDITPATLTDSLSGSLSHQRNRPGRQASNSHESDSESDTPLEPPPSYEQSVHPSSASSDSSTPSTRVTTGQQQSTTALQNPFLSQTSSFSSRSRSRSRNHSSRPHREEMDYEQDAGQLEEPRLGQRHSPSAPPITLLATTSAAEASAEITQVLSNQMQERRRRRSATAPDNRTPTTGSGISRQARRGKLPIHNSSKEATVEDEQLVFGAQPAMSPSYLHLPDLSSSSSSIPQHQGYFGHRGSSTHDIQSSRTERRLAHKQDLAQYNASAPQLSIYPQPSDGHSQSSESWSSQPMSSAAHAPILSLSESVVPAPPARLLQFRSREPSAVPACPYLLCRKPIAVTKTRRERGVTVWIVCGLLFLCNTYWTTQSLMSHFASPSQGRIVTGASESGFSARGEAGHLVKGFLGFKTHRYQDPTFKSYQQNQMATKRPTIATVGIVQDEQSMIRAVLSFCFLALMAILRWWLCLTPVLVRSLFDTVHSCPHSHPYPYQEEIDQEQREIETLLVATSGPPRSQEQLSGVPTFYGNDEKARLRARDQEDQAAATVTSTVTSTATGITLADPMNSTNTQPRSSNNELRTITHEHNDHNNNENNTATTVTQRYQAADGPKSRYKFFKRLGALRQRRKEIVVTTVANATASVVTKAQAVAESSFGPDGMVTSTVSQIRQKKLSWRVRRRLRKAERRRQEVIKASQDIGRYSLLFELGSFFRIGGWKQSVLGPSKIQAEAYED